MRAPARYALLAFALALAVTAARPIEDKVREGEEEGAGRGGGASRGGQGGKRGEGTQKLSTLPPPLPQTSSPPTPPRLGLLRRLLQLNSTQTTGPWAPIVGTTSVAFPGYYPRLDLTRNGSTQITATSVPDPNRVSAFPTGSAFPVAPTTASGTLAAGGAGLASIADFNDPAVVGPPGV